MNTVDLEAMRNKVFFCIGCGAKHFIYPHVIPMAVDDDGTIESPTVNKVSVVCGCGHETVLYENAAPQMLKSE